MTQQLDRTIACVLTTQAIQRPTQFQMLPDREGVKQSGIFRQDADRASDVDVLRRHNLPGDAHVACGWRQQSRQQLDRRRLPRAVGPQEAEERAWRHLQIQIADGRDATEVLADAAYLDSRR